MAKQKVKKHSKNSAVKNPVKKLSSDQFRMLGIGLLVVVALIVLVFIRPLFVGKAIETAGGNKIDLRYDTASAKLLLELTVTEPVNAVSFDLFSDTLPCGSLTFASPLGWEYEESGCVSEADGKNRYTYGVASAVESKEGTFTVVTMAPTSTPPDSFTVNLENVDVYAGSTDLFTGTEDGGTFTLTTRAEAVAEVPAVAEAPAPQQQTAPAAAPAPATSESSGGSSRGGGGGGSACRRNWKCNEWSACDNGQQSRACHDLNNCAPTKTVGYKTFPVYLVGPEKPAETQLCEEVAGVKSVQPTAPPVKVERVSVSVPQQPVVAVSTAKAPLNKTVVAIGVLAVLGTLAGVLVHRFRRPKALLESAGKETKGKG